MHNDDFIGETGIEESARCCRTAFHEEPGYTSSGQPHEGKAKIEAAIRRSANIEKPQAFEPGKVTGL